MSYISLLVQVIGAITVVLSSPEEAKKNATARSRSGDNGALVYDTGKSARIDKPILLVGMRVAEDIIIVKISFMNNL